MKMKYISMKLGKVSKYSMDKLKKNYENVSAIVFKLYQDEDEVVILLFVPLSVELEVERVLASLNFEEYRFKANYKGTPYEWIDNLSIRKDEINSEIDSIRQELATMKIEHTDEIEKYNSRLSMEYKIEELKSYIVCTNEFFYLTGWVPAYKKNELLNNLAMYEDNLIIIFKGTKDAREGLEPPTCLKNNYIVKPFESVVKLYGIPSYNEVDPTGFLGLSYMLLFGAMFGDVGQGMILFIIGEVLNRRNHRPNLGGVVARLGMSSVIFGFFSIPTIL
jgi:V/A-type H+-transporting ATPase subunit I